MKKAVVVKITNQCFLIILGFNIIALLSTCRMVLKPDNLVSQTRNFLPTVQHSIHCVHRLHKRLKKLSVVSIGTAYEKVKELTVER